MYILQHAMKNIRRNLGRNILMGAIILVIIVATVVSLIINNTSGRIIDDYKAQFGSKVSIAPDLQQMYNQGKDFERVTSEQYLAFADSEYLQESIFSAEVPSFSETLKAVGEGESTKPTQMVIQGPNGSAQVSPTMRIVGNSNIDNLTEFSSGERQLTEGKVYNERNECIVSKEFAELNSISVGDAISVSSIMGENITYEMTVTGIYMDATSEYGDMPFHTSFMNRRNEILTSFATVMGDENEAAGAMNLQATYFLKNPDSLADFEAELREKGLPAAYSVSTDDASYSKTVGPVEAMKSIFLVFMVVVIVLGTITLTLLSSIAIRERKYEIGVLRAMGMKKSKVALGLISETLILTVICLVIGLGVGSVVSQPTANLILQGQVAAAEKAQAASGPGKFLMVKGQSNMSNTETTPVSEIDVQLGFDTLGEIALIALFLAAASSIASISKITKYEPIKILMERN